ncbi:MAG TPA: TolC family protein [Acidobacteriaceae bacterium]|nr:TolC family protein [Acidobacteriaceae bacterium]
MHRHSPVVRINAATLLILFVVTFAPASRSAHAQISLVSAVDLALKNNPRVRLAQADVDKSTAVLKESKDVYIPAITVGSGLGWSYGYPLGQPSVVNATLQGVVLSWSQRDYIRASRLGLQAALLNATDARAAVEEDTVVTYLALDRDLAREQALDEQLARAEQLVTIVGDRLNAGVDTGIDLTQAKLTAAQIRLNYLNAQDERALDQQRLADLIGLPSQNLTTTHDSIPQLGAPAADHAKIALPESPSVRAALESAEAKQQIAWGDQKKLYRPQIFLASQYSLFAKFNNYQVYFPTNPQTGKSVFQYNNAGIGIQVSWPIFDRALKDKAKESAADAVHAFAEYQNARIKDQEGHAQLARSTQTLSAKAEVADLEQQLSSQQLAAIRTQLQASAANPNAPQRTPKDQANAEIDERGKYITMLNSRFDLEQAQVQLMRAQGNLDTWLRNSAGSPPTAPAPNP